MGAASVYDTVLPRDEFETRLAAALLALDGPEGVDIRDQIAWFARRYPEPLDRIAYCRRKYREAMATQAGAAMPPPSEEAP
jgi:hypothetical protein